MYGHCMKEKVSTMKCLVLLSISVTLSERDEGEDFVIFCKVQQQIV